MYISRVSYCKTSNVVALDCMYVCTYLHIRMYIFACTYICFCILVCYPLTTFFQKLWMHVIMKFCDGVIITVCYHPALPEYHYTYIPCKTLQTLGEGGRESYSTYVRSFWVSMLESHRCMPRKVHSWWPFGHVEYNTYNVCTYTSEPYTQGFFPQENVAAWVVYFQMGPMRSLYWRRLSPSLPLPPLNMIGKCLKRFMMLAWGSLEGFACTCSMGVST